jgi:protein-disulfide isomerase
MCPVPADLRSSMSPLNKQWPFAALISSVFLILLIAACGPAAPQRQPADAEPASERPAVTRPPNVEGSIPRDSEGLERDEKGIQVGFTAEGFPFRGDPNAPVVIEEYSSYQCPFCARFNTQTFPSLDANQIAAGEVLLIFRDFPLSSQPQSPLAHNAARCAGEQGATAYWAVHDRLFEDIRAWAHSGANQVFAGFGEEIGLEMESFTNCLETNKYAGAVESDWQSGRARGVSSTPTFFINGLPLIGAQPLAVFNQAISAVLAGQPLPGDQAAGSPSLQPDEPIVAPTPVPLSEDFAASLGDPKAPVTIVEFSDYQCPFCRRHSMETMPFIMAEMVETGRVYYVFKDLPLDNIHDEARPAAVAARCAGEQDVYWEMHDLLFEEQQEWAGRGTAVTDLFAGYAVELGLDRNSFARCLSSGRYDSAVQESIDEAFSLGINGTPFFFVNGYPLSGALPAHVFAYVVELAEEDQLGEALAEAAAEQQRQQQEQQQQAQGPPQPVDVPIGDAFTLGRADAPITIVEYTDYQCSFCRRHAVQTLPLLQQYVENGTVRYVFKDFPLTAIHDQAVKAAEAVRCAGDQNARLEMHHRVFEKQEEWANRDDAAALFGGYAGELGLNRAAFDQCLSSDKYEAAVLADGQEGARLGVQATPTFFLNGYILAGAYPIEAFEQAIATLLEE